MHDKVHKGRQDRTSPSKVHYNCYVENANIQIYLSTPDLPKKASVRGGSLCLLLLHVEDNRNYYGPDVTKYLKFCCTEHMNFIDCKLFQANTFKAIPILETSVIANQTTKF